jgi:cellulose biosynthesis protein BcsQ
MSFIIALIGNDTNENKKATVGFNLSLVLSKKNKKTLLISQIQLSSTLKADVKKINKGIIPPFVLTEYDSNLSVLNFFDPKLNLAKYDYLKLFPKQLQLLNDKFDYIIIDTNYLSNSLTNSAISYSKKIIAVCDSENFSAIQLQKMLTVIRKNQFINQNLKFSAVILNNYDQNIHMESLLEITKMINDKYLFVTLPRRKELQNLSEQSIKFIKNNQ